MSLVLGIENLSQSSHTAWGRVGLCANQASIDRRLIPSWKVCQEIFGSRLVCLFGPQHGFESTVQYNMEESEHSRHEPSNLPVYSLYSETREPTESMLKEVDTILVDLQHSGCRVYTYKYTLAACMRAAKKYGKRVVVLDRPNPLGGVVIEGNVLNTQFQSFVGEFDIPMRHGLTMAELALYFNQTIKLADLEVVKLSGWQPEQYFHEWGQPWVLTSPNIPTAESLYAFVGNVLFEGSNISEGRGTCLPFQMIGAPFLNRSFTQRVSELLKNTQEIHLRHCSFIPTFNKWTGKECQGYHLIFRSKCQQLYRIGLASLRAAIECGASDFAWEDKPYEYNFDTLAIKLIMGEDLIARLSQSSFDLDDSHWSSGLDAYRQRSRNALCYERELAIS
jgi:uncharacterized protein YbbC (DUF1343 family)